MKKIHLTRNKLNELAKPRLIDLMLERLEYERLIEEGKDPRELLHYKYQNVPSDVIDAVIDIDPTKKKSYSQWLLSHWNDESDIIMNNLNNGRIEKLFQHYKEHSDIQIKDCPSVEEGLRMFVPEEDTVLTKSDKPKTYIENLGREVDSRLANDFDIVYDDGDWIIAVPNTYEAECKLGENMRWCTANHFGNGESYYNNYLSKGGKYYVNFDMTRPENAKGKDYPFTRYQFHFESNQFMDENDDPVELDSIGMPDGAKEYYSDEGYDTDIFESLEARMERYEEQRWGWNYRINDDLYLNIAYDNDFEFEEPDGSTDFFIFDENDNVDPISWESVPNPHFNEDVVKLTSDWLCLLKYSDDEVLIVIKENNGSRWRDWEVYRCEHYIVLPDEIGVFGISEGKYTFFSTDGSERFNKLNISNSSPCEKMFINEPCTKADEGKWDRIFIETVTGGYHNLFALAPNDGMGEYFECLVRRDTPINGECFTINEMGVIEGEYGKYRAYNEEDYEEEQTFTRYNLVERLPNGDCVISVDESNNENNNYREIKNILRNGEGEPLLSEWFDEFIDLKNGLYVVEKFWNGSNRFGYFNSQGKQLGCWYDNWGFSDSGIAFGVVKGNNRRCHLIDPKTSEVFAEFKQFMSIRKDYPIVIALCNDGIVRGYDYDKREFCYNEFENMKRIIDSCNSYLCKLKNSEENVIFNYDTQKIEARNVADVKYLSVAYDLFELTKTNGKHNAYDMSYHNGYEVLPTDADSDIKWINGSLFYMLNNRFFLYNYRNKKMLINQNGFDIEPYEISRSYNLIVFRDENCQISYSIGSDDAYIQGWKTIDKTGYRIDESTPQEVINLYNRITSQGQQQEPTQQQEPSYAYTEQFKRMVNRMMIAEKLKYNDILD